METKRLKRIDKKILKRALKFIPCALIMILIFSFSAADSEESSAVSGSVTESMIWFAHIRLDPALIEALEGFVRKAAHFAEYMVLAIAAFYSLTGWEIRPLYRYGGLQIFCSAYALSDEIHQYFVPGRWCQMSDVALDSLGAAAGLALCGLACEFLKRRRRRR